MSKCISRHGEYSEHTVGLVDGDDGFGEKWAEWTCRYCYALDEDALLDALTAERERAEALLTTIAAQSHSLRRAETALTNTQAVLVMAEPDRERRMALWRDFWRRRIDQRKGDDR